jgi:hypothetical protein
LHYYIKIFNIKLKILSPLKKLSNERKTTLTDIAKIMERERSELLTGLEEHKDTLFFILEGEKL